jgi:hypothetical protein
MSVYRLEMYLFVTAPFYNVLFCDVPFFNVPFCNVQLCDVPLANVPLCNIPYCNVPLCIGTKYYTLGTLLNKSTVFYFVVLCILAGCVHVVYWKHLRNQSEYEYVYNISAGQSQSILRTESFAPLWFKNKLGVREELTAEERGPRTTALRVKRDSADPALAKGRYDFETIWSTKTWPDRPWRGVSTSLYSAQFCHWPVVLNRSCSVYFVQRCRWLWPDLVQLCQWPWIFTVLQCWLPWPDLAQLCP